MATKKWNESGIDDFSTAIEQAKANGGSYNGYSVNDLTNMRQDKINSQYGGNEPTYGTTGQTYSQYSASQTPTKTDNTNYAAMINDAIMRGSDNYDQLEAWLNAKADKQQSGAYNGQANTDMGYFQNVWNYIKNGRTMQQYQDLMNQQYPSYQPNEMDSLANQLANAALNMKYDDWLNSEQYQALAKRYGLQGQQSLQNTLGQVASRTGGLASSYATTAAQQSYNDFMSKLEEAAYNMYGDEQNTALNKANAAYNYADVDYQRYLNELAQWNSDRSFGAGILGDIIAQSNYQNEWNQALADADYNKAADKAAQLAKYGDFSGYRALGYSDAEIAGMENTWKAQQSKGRGGSGGGTKTTKSSVPTTEQEFYEMTNWGASVASPEEFAADKKQGRSYASSYATYEDYLAGKYDTWLRSANRGTVVANQNPQSSNNITSDIWKSIDEWKDKNLSVDQIMQRLANGNYGLTPEELYSIEQSLQ